MGSGPETQNLLHRNIAQPSGYTDTGLLQNQTQLIDAHVFTTHAHLRHQKAKSNLLTTTTVMVPKGGEGKLLQIEIGGRKTQVRATKHHFILTPR